MPKSVQKGRTLSSGKKRPRKGCSISCETGYSVWYVSLSPAPREPVHFWRLRSNRSGDRFLGRVMCLRRGLGAYGGDGQVSSTCPTLAECAWVRGLGGCSNPTNPAMVHLSRNLDQRWHPAHYLSGPLGLGIAAYGAVLGGGSLSDCVLAGHWFLYISGLPVQGPSKNGPESVEFMRPAILCWPHFYAAMALKWTPPVYRACTRYRHNPVNDITTSKPETVATETASRASRGPVRRMRCTRLPRPHRPATSSRAA